jgi:tetratricopeptide (TPR) repeat protein
MSMMRRLVVSLALAAAAAGCRTAAPSAPASAARLETPAPAPERAVRAAEDPRLVEAERARAEGRLEAAEALLETVAREAPRDPRPYLGLARVHVAKAKLPEALADAEKAVALGGGREARYLRGRVLGLSRRFEAAVPELRSVVAEDPKDVLAWATLAAVETDLGDDVEAGHAFARSVEAAGADVAVDRYWTQLLSMPPDPVQPQEALDRCTRGHAAALEGKWNEAQHEYLNALKHSQRFEWCIAGVADSFRHAGDPQRAEDIYRRLLPTFAPGKAEVLADVRGRFAALLVARSKPAEALEHVRAALEVRPERAALLDTLALACDGTGDAPCARDAYARLLARPHVPPEVRARAEMRLAALGGAPAAASVRR